MKLIDSKTYKNLAKAYAGECQARTRYRFLHYAATQQGYKAIANIIKEIILQEFHHARMLYTFIQTASDEPIANINISSGYPFRQKWDFLENFKFSAQDENLEATKIYPEYAKIAQEEGFKDIAGLFNNLAQVESCHQSIFEQIYAQLSDGSLYKKPNKVKWKCLDCGYEAESKQAWKQCPLCQAEQGAVAIKIQQD
ncbi:MAG: rubrerythrin family protein [Clostridiales bacterium]|nr:rubrerythrin family protein [Clostridiales bacterium]